MKASSGSSNWLITFVALALVALVVGIIVVLASQSGLLRRPTPVAATARPVQVTRVVPGTDLTQRAFPTLPPVWTDTPVPSPSPTVPTLTPRATETSTITPTFPPTITPAPTVTGPTPTRRPTPTPSKTPTVTPTTTRTRVPPTATSESQ